MARGWEPLLEQVARERYPRLVARAMLLVPSRSDAEDLVQEALVATFTARARFESVGQAEQYVRRAIVSRFVDRVRRSDRERSAVDADGRSAQPSTADLAEHGLSTNLEVALLALSPRVRACVVLRHLDDLSVRETASLLGPERGRGEAVRLGRRGRPQRGAGYDEPRRPRPGGSRADRGGASWLVT